MGFGDGMGWDGGGGGGGTVPTFQYFLSKMTSYKILCIQHMNSLRLISNM